MTWSDVAQLLTALAAVGGLVVSILNRRSIAIVHKTTNSLAKRNEEIAQKLGEQEGRAAEKANPSK